MTKRITTKNSAFACTGYTPVAYHIDTVWNSGAKERLEITGVEWVDTDAEAAARIDIITEMKLFDYGIQDECWLLTVSNSTGDSFSHQYRAVITYVDIFNHLTDAENTVQAIQDFIAGIKCFSLPNNGYIPYINSGSHRMLSLAHLNAVFELPDGVFLNKIVPADVKRWPYDDKPKL
jgi:hypothetical protein